MDVQDASQRWLGGPGLFPGLMTCALAVQYLCVPETDHFINLALLGLGLTAVEVITRTSELSARIVLATLVVWAGWFGATGRGSAQVGAVVAFWPTVLALGALRRARSLPSPSLDLVALAVASGLLAGVAVARTGGIAPTTLPALRSASLCLPLSLAALIVWDVLSRRRRGHSADSLDSS